MINKSFLFVVDIVNEIGLHFVALFYIQARKKRYIDRGFFRIESFKLDQVGIENIELCVTGWFGTILINMKCTARFHFDSKLLITSSSYN